MVNEPTNQEQPTGSRKTASRRALTRDAAVASICGFVVVLMVGASYAAVPFYNWFFRATGFNGTTPVATSAPAGAPPGRPNNRGLRAQTPARAAPRILP